MIYLKIRMNEVFEKELKSVSEYLNRIYKPGNESMKFKAYSRENCNKAIEMAFNLGVEYSKK